MQLFNKDNKGSQELYELSGTFQAATDYQAIAPEVEAATIEVAAIIGGELINKASTFYLSGAPEQKIFVDKVRRPVALLAILNYSSLTGLSHGDTGRKIKVDDNEKIPFEWQLDRDDRAMRERYYRSLDNLFTYLADNSDEDWKASELYKKQSATIINSLTELENVYPVEHSRYTYYMLLPLIAEAQNRLIAILQDPDLAKVKASEIALAAAKRYVVLSALVTAISRWSITVFPVEVARQFAPSYQGNRERRVATTEEIEWTLRNLREQIAAAETELRVELDLNSFTQLSLLPENNPKNKYFTV